MSDIVLVQFPKKKDHKYGALVKLVEEAYFEGYHEGYREGLKPEQKGTIGLRWLASNTLLKLKETIQRGKK